MIIESSTKAPSLSVARIVIVWAPRSFFVGVPDKSSVAESNVSQVGKPEALSVNVSPASESVNVLDGIVKLNGAYLSVATSLRAVLTAGAVLVAVPVLASLLGQPSASPDTLRILIET